MRPIVWRWLAASSLFVAALAALAETRPQYGGTLHIALHAAPASLDPPQNGQADSFAGRDLTLLIFDTLVTTDAAGVHAALATSWQASLNNKRWQFRLRHGVKFHDGTAFTAEVAAASLHAANPTWNATANGDSVVIECDGPELNLPGKIALPRNAIAKRNAGQPIGTGPFRIVDWQPGKKLTLAAFEDYWRGRPFLDGIEIELGKSFHDQWTALELGRADLVEVPPEQMHRVSLEGHRLMNSEPMELIAVLYTRDAQTPDEKLLRESLALSVDRASMRSVLLQGSGQASAGILPNWMSGYGFVFSADSDLARARHTREQVHAVPTWTIGYDSADPIARLMSERVALNAKDAGLMLQPTSAANTDMRLVRIPLAPDAWISLESVAAMAGMQEVKNESRSIEDLYSVEQKLLATQRIIPLFHLPVSYAASAALKNWNVSADGTIDLTDAWVGNRNP
jgi:peptide/nickel transport system substrate-binding protein